MNEELKSAAADPPLGPPGIQTLGSSTLYNLLEEMIRLRSRNEAQHKLFAQDLSRMRDDLKTSFNSFAADTQRAYQDLRKETQGEKKFSMELLLLLLEISQDLEHITDHKPKPNDPEAVARWIEAVQVQTRKVQAAVSQKNVKEYEAKPGEAYTPALHKRVGSERVEGMPPLRIARTVKKGYASQQPEFVLQRPEVIVTD